MSGYVRIRQHTSAYVSIHVACLVSSVSSGAAAHARQGRARARPPRQFPPPRQPAGSAVAASQARAAAVGGGQERGGGLARRCGSSTVW
jgi:hypothetical protein